MDKLLPNASKCQLKNGRTWDPGVSGNKKLLGGTGKHLLNNMAEGRGLIGDRLIGGDIVGGQRRRPKTQASGNSHLTT
jgi:hypothetical protein